MKSEEEHDAYFNYTQNDYDNIWNLNKLYISFYINGKIKWFVTAVDQFCWRLKNFNLITVVLMTYERVFSFWQFCLPFRIVQQKELVVYSQFTHYETDWLHDWFG